MKMKVGVQNDARCYSRHVSSIPTPGRAESEIQTVPLDVFSLLSRFSFTENRIFLAVLAE